METIHALIKEANRPFISNVSLFIHQFRNVTHKEFVPLVNKGVNPWWNEDVPELHLGPRSSLLVRWGPNRHDWLVIKGVDIIGEPLHHTFQCRSDWMVIFWTCDNHRIGSLDPLIDILDYLWCVPVIILTKHWDRLNINHVNLVLVLKVLCHEFQQHSVIGMVSVWSGNCSNFQRCHFLISNYHFTAILL